MKMNINQIGIITLNFNKMMKFYHEVLNFPIKLQQDNYVEFENKGVRFAIASNDIMYQVTKDKTFHQKKQGHSLELAFQVDIPSEVDKRYQELINLGAIPITSPNDMPWGQRAAFFADPDYNIHEIFATLEEGK